jgi:sulfotransferase
MTASTIHLISGLPRSGSTPLCALLGQNPRFSAAMTSPVASLVGALMPKMSSGSEFSVFFSDDRRRRLLRGLFEANYADVPADHENSGCRTNTRSTVRISMKSLYPHCRMNSIFY